MVVLLNGVYLVKELAVRFRGLAYYILKEAFVDKFLKQYGVGGCELTFAGHITTEDDLGVRTHYYVGLFWSPWECKTGKTVAAENHVSIKGNPGGKVSIRVFTVSLKNRKVLRELEPTFRNSGKNIWVWENREALAVLLDGERDAETWVVSHWRMFSGRTVFDLAKNRFRPEDFENLEAGGDNGHGEQPKIAPIEVGPDPQDIAKSQLDNGTAKRASAR